MDGKTRCFGNGLGKEFYAQYHDTEWGSPEHDDTKLFELLILEGAQAGLSWELILKRREGYRAAFHHFDPAKVAVMGDAELEALRENPAIIRNRLKIYATRQNGKVFLDIQREFGSFDRFIWNFVKGKPIVTHREELKEVPCRTELSDAISKELKTRGMTFVGSKIIYSYLQAIGAVNDHLATCWLLSTSVP